MFIADLHIHSKYSLATSRDCDAQHLALWARRKGIALIGTGDFTHPVWRAELREALEPAGEGLYSLRGDTGPTATRFVVTGEISTIYKRDGRTRKVHHLIILPSLEAASELAHRLEAVGNIKSDGRPILGIDSRELVKIIMDAAPEAIYIPAHVWTPHFSVFGAFSGFSSIEECYGDMAKCVFALETGLSSDPDMNRRCSMFDKYSLISNSDAHSPQKLGREANLMDCEMSYSALKRAIETGEGLAGTLEFFPEEGKYHLDGHRNCALRLEPEETRALGGICPTCGKRLTVGVLSRVEELADRLEPINRAPFESLIPLSEILADCLDAPPASKRVNEAYMALIAKAGPEFHILREMSLSDIASAGGEILSEGIKRLRENRVLREAGYDGAYGRIRLFGPGEREAFFGQTALFAMPERAQRKISRPAERNAAAAPEEVRTESSLNAAQLEAVRAPERVIAVIAGPGTGKTKTLTERIARLIEEEGVRPERITAVTFTNQAAREMRERLSARLGGKALAKRVNIGTFHAISLSLIEKKPIANRARMARLTEEAGIDARLISQYKNGLDASPGAEAISAYQALLDAEGARDLDDILLEALSTEKTPRAEHLLVDEFQDINPVCHALVIKWAEGAEGLFAIGDPDQSIYGFRGANADCFNELKRRFPDARVITLTENYRSAPAIINCALATINRNPGDARRFNAHRPDEIRPRIASAPDEFAEAGWIAREITRLTGGMDMRAAQKYERERAHTRSFSDIAVLARTRRQLDIIERALRREDIPCQISGGANLPGDARTEALVSFFRALIDRTDSISLRRALTVLWGCPLAVSIKAEKALAEDRKLEEALAIMAEFPELAPFIAAASQLAQRLERAKPRAEFARLAELAGLSGRNIDALLNAAVFEKSIREFIINIDIGEEGDVRRASRPGIESGAVRLMTLHAAKGLEFPAVFIAGLARGALPLERAGEATDVCEERRLFYVGITRAREELIITFSGEESPFIGEMPQSAVRERVKPRPPKIEQTSLF